MSLLVQWQNEIRSKAPHLKYFVYHGDNVTMIHSEHSRKRVVDKLRNYDIVLTTMSKLVELTSNRNQQGQLMNCLKRVSWHRLVVDECQFLKNDTTAIARAASEIDAKHIWMLSGTPLTNKLDDLRGELSLLRVWPFTLGTSLDEEWQDHFWSNDVKSNWDTKNGKSLPLIRNLMAALSMRHSRLQTRLDGSQLVDLPPRTDGFMAVTMDSASSATFINHWVEALAIKVLQMLGRFDVRITALIGKLQQYATNPALICKDLDLLDNTLSYLDTRDTIRVVDLETAISTEKKERSKDPLILSELINLANMGERCLPLCEYCKKVKKRPSYMSCGHSLCAECCGFLLRDRGQFDCPFCKTNIHTGDIVEVEIPAQQMLTRGTKSMNTAIHLDLEDSEVEKVLANQRLFQPYNPTEQEEKTFVQLQPASTYNLVHQEDGISFQEIYGVHTIPTFASLMDQPRPTLCLTSEVEAREKISSISNPEEMEALIWHAVACKNQTNPKINAICSAIQKIRDSSLEAKICIFSSYRAILDEVEDALDNVRYTVEYNMNTKDKLLPGQHVIYFENRDGKDTNGVSEEGTVVKEAAPDEWSQGKSARECANYKIKIRGERFIIASRNDLRVPPVEVDNVKSKLIRRRRVQDSKEEESREVSGEGCEEVSGEGYEDESEQESEQESAPPVDCNDIEKLSVNGSDDRYAISMPVEGKRSPAPSDELKVGYKIRILPVGNLGLFESGCIVAVNRKGNENFLSYDVLPDGHTIESNVWNDQFVVKKDILRKVPPSRLRDKGEHNWLPAVIKGISCKNNLNDLHFVKNDSDPFETALGYVRVDGSAGTANRRGEILDTFKSDPMTSICLLTKRAAGVGINLTEANHVIILEPSMDAHDELQSICRVHRIGQTRKVSVQKFYIVGSIEERILKRRQQRGELSLSINSFVGMSTDEEGTNKKELKAKTSEILSSKSMTYEDLQLLLGVLN